jgi:prophage regulatory protein
MKTAKSLRHAPQEPQSALLRRGQPANDASATTLLRLPELLKRIGIGKSKLYDMVAKNEFPQPVKIGRASVWRSDEIEATIRRLSAVR